MIPTTINDSKLTGSLGGTVTNMTVDLSNLSHIMNVLTDLYEDGELAVIREYSTNASDSHAMSGSTSPIEVFLPTPLRQTFEVQDFGLGMSPSDITETYGSYGASSKRETNDANGCLGLGSKSALTYTNMFTVRAVKDGVLTEVAIYRDDRGAGSIEVIDTKATELPNGVRIIVPTHADSQFERKALDFYSTWKPGTVKVHGFDLKHVSENVGAFFVDAKTLIVPKTGYRNESGNIFVVMGGVTYPAPADTYNRWGYSANYNVYYFAEMQPTPEIDFTPSRESLNMTTRTTALVEDVRERAGKTAVIDFIAQEIDKAKSLEDAVDVWETYRVLRNDIGTPSYKGTTLISVYVFPQTASCFYTDNDARTLMIGKVNRVNVVESRNSLFVNKPSELAFTFKAKAALRKIVKDNGYDSTVIMTDKPDHALMAKCPSMTWQEVLDTKVEVTYAKGAASKIEYFWTLGTDHSYSQRPLPTTGFSEIVVITGTHNYVDKSWVAAHPKTLFVVTAHRRIDKFKRENPTAIDNSEWMKKSADKLPKLSADELLYLSVNRYDIHNMQRVKDAGFCDATMKKILSIAANPKRVAKIASVRQQWYNYGRQIESTTNNYWSETYPLADANNMEHTLIYMNALKSAGKV